MEHPSEGVLGQGVRVPGSTGANVGAGVGTISCGVAVATGCRVGVATGCGVGGATGCGVGGATGCGVGGATGDDVAMVVVSH